jgi:VCBS repeat-containing protein
LVSEDSSVSGSTHHHTLSGSIAFVDPDGLDHPTVSLAVTDIRHTNPVDEPFNAAVQPLMDGFHYTVEQYGNYGVIHWTYDVQDSALDFLAQDQELNVSATLSVGGLSGAALSTLNVTLRGSNDAPVIPGSNTTAVTLAMTENGTTGSFTFTDPDWWPDGHTVEFVPRNPDSHGFMNGGTNVETGSGGDGSITWFYTVNPEITPRQHDVFDIILHDQYGGVATHTVDFLLV